MKPSYYFSIIYFSVYKKNLKKLHMFLPTDIFTVDKKENHDRRYFARLY